MDPNTTSNPNFDLPPVQLPEAKPKQPLNPGELAPQQMTEQQNMEQTAAPAQAPAQAATPSGLLPQVDPVSQQPIAPPANQAQATTNDAPANGALDADDGDLIEKAWVTKAKAIVNQTREDPYQQNKQITKVKSEYIKKRYNKDVKISDE